MPCARAAARRKRIDRSGIHAFGVLPPLILLSSGLVHHFTDSAGACSLGCAERREQMPDSSQDCDELNQGDAINPRENLAAPPVQQLARQTMRTPRRNSHPRICEL